mgnify:FL=1
MSRPNAFNDEEIIRLIKQSEYYNRSTGKWVSNAEARNWIAYKLMVSEESVFRALRRLVNNKVLHPTDYRGVYHVKENAKVG